MADPASFAKMVPGFDFLQGLVKNAGSALPSITQWVAPTLNPEELEKRIEELRTVQFWLEQNARMLGATIQALEVQRMTLSTLKTMNVQMTDLRDSLSLKPAATAASSSAAKATSGKSSSTKKSGAGQGAEKPAALPMGSVDPMQWWGALTKQFTQLATSAMKDQATDAAKNLGAAMMKQSFDAAGETLKSAAAAPIKMASKAASSAGTVANSAARTAVKMAQAATAPKPATKAAPKKRAPSRKR